ncbi:hypothetical protein ACL1CN_10530 [Corynebacterium striatum]|uniref:hypothetical protein n=1 Tax=Corynebacterium striatum TaxID=43770 RepID=UPI003ACE5240
MSDNLNESTPADTNADNNANSGNESQQETNNIESQDTNGQAPQSEPRDDERISQLNAEAAKWRTKFREQEKAVAERDKRQQELEAKFDAYKQDLAKAMGLAEEDREEDLAKKYQEQAAAADKRYNELKQRVALTEAVHKAKADPELTIPFIKGGGQLATLDPSVDDYEAQVAELVAQTVEANPKLRAQVVPVSSGNASTPSDNSEQRRITLADLDNMNEVEIYEARKAGKLNHLFK